MGRIIKLTESQLRDVVNKVINEQKASPNASPAAKQIWTKLSQAQSGTGGLGTDETALVSAISLIKSVELYTEVVNMMRGVSSIGNYKSIVQLLNGELESDDLKVFQQIAAMLKKIGVTLTAKTRKGSQRVGAERGATYQYDELVVGSIRQVVGKTPAPVVDPNKPKYTNCTGFPIKYGCKQAEVGKIQQCLGLRVDYSFGPATLEAIAKALIYRPAPGGSTGGPFNVEANKKLLIEKGLDVVYYNYIMKRCKSKTNKKTPAPTPAPVVDTRTKTEPLKIAPRQIQQMPVNIDLPKLQAIPTPGIDPARKAAILGQIKDRGFDKVYKGQALTPEEKQWLESYLGSEIDKDKMKPGGNEKLRFPNA